MPGSRIVDGKAVGERQSFSPSVVYRIGKGLLANAKGEDSLRVEDLGIIHIFLEAATVSNASWNADISIFCLLPR